MSKPTGLSYRYLVLLNRVGERAEALIDFMNVDDPEDRAAGQALLDDLEESVIRMKAERVAITQIAKERTITKDAGLTADDV